MKFKIIKKADIPKTLTREIRRSEPSDIQKAMQWVSETRKAITERSKRQQTAFFTLT